MKLLTQLFSFYVKTACVLKDRQEKHGSQLSKQRGSSGNNHEGCRQLWDPHGPCWNHSLHSPTQFHSLLFLFYLDDFLIPKKMHKSYLIYFKAKASHQSNPCSKSAYHLLFSQTYGRIICFHFCSSLSTAFQLLPMSISVTKVTNIIKLNGLKPKPKNPSFIA